MRTLIALLWAVIVLAVVYFLVGISPALVLAGVIIVARLGMAAGNGLVEILPFPIPNLLILVSLAALIGGGVYLFSKYGWIPVAGLAAIVVGYAIIVGSKAVANA